MPKFKKIDKKNAVTFQLVHRSRQDPLVADEDAPQRVLRPVEGKETKKDQEKALEELQKYGIYYDDDYNYLQYLKDSKDNQLEWPDNIESELEQRRKNNEKKVLLPSSVFASEVDEDGMFAKAAAVSDSHLHLDPDVLAAMDDDFDFADPDNQLEDNFMELGDGVASDQELSGDEEYFDSDEELDEVCSIPEKDNRMLKHVMSSSVIRRNNQLSLLDAKFDKMYADYEDNEIGALDCEEIEGHVPITSDILLKYADEFEKSQKTEQMDKCAPANMIREQLEMSSDEDEELVAIRVPEKEKWDCESILSTYSNIYNHPKLIKESKMGKIHIDKKTGIPANVLGSDKLTVTALNQLNEDYKAYESSGPQSVGQKSIISHLSTLSIRNKDELPEERRERKKQLREYRRERRLERKMNTAAFKEEEKRQVKISMNNRNNVQGNRIL